MLAGRIKAMNTLKQPAGAVPVGAAPIPASTAALAIAARAAPANCWAELITPSSLDSVVVRRRRRRVTSFAFPFGNVGILIDLYTEPPEPGPSAQQRTVSPRGGAPRVTGVWVRNRIALVLRMLLIHMFAACFV